MFLALTTLVCIVAFAICALLLKQAFRRMLARYAELQERLTAHESALLVRAQDQTFERVHREIDAIADERRVLQRNIALFRFLFPAEYDRAVYAGDRIIAQYRRLIALSTRASS
jgi:hypothetical protein